MKLKKVISMAVLFALAATVAGCTTKDESKQVTQSGIQSIKIFMDLKPELSEGDNALKAEIEKSQGVKLDFEIPPTVNYKERLQLMLASGTYADVILFQDNKDKIFTDAVKNGIVIPLNKYLSNAPDIEKYSYPVSWDALKIKGGQDIYGIPRTSIMRADGYYVRADWLYKLGIKLPESGEVTLDEFTNILKRFTFDDPDGNGNKDTYGLAVAANSLGYLEPFVQWPFGLLGWQKVEGTNQYMDLKYSQDKDNYKKALEYAQTIFKGGMVNPNAPVSKDSSTAQDFFNSGRAGVITGFAGYMNTTLQKMQAINPNAKLAYITGIKDKDGIVKGSAYGAGLYGLFAISKTAKNPEKIIQLFNWMLSDGGWEKLMTGVEGVTYTVENGVKKPTDKYKKFGIGKFFLRRKGDVNFFIPLGLSDAESNNVKSLLGKCIDNFAVSNDRGYKPEAASKQAFLEYEKKFNQTITEIVIGTKPVSEFDKALDDWYKNGGAEYINEMNKYISSFEK